MAFEYNVAVTLPALFDVDARIIEHFSGFGFRLTDQGNGFWTFHRGSKRAVLYRFDIRAYDTTLQVYTRAVSEDEMEFWFEYDIWTFMSMPVAEDVARLETEVAEFVSSCLPAVKEPRDLMSVSRLPGRYLPLWLVLVLIFVLVPITVACLVIFLFALTRR